MAGLGLLSGKTHAQSAGSHTQLHSPQRHLQRKPLRPYTSLHACPAALPLTLVPLMPRVKQLQQLQQHVAGGQVRWQGRRNLHQRQRRSWATGQRSQQRPDGGFKCDRWSDLQTNKVLPLLMKWAA